MISNRKRKEVISGLIEDARRFRFCGPAAPSDDAAAVTAGYRHLVTQFKAFASPVLASPSASRLTSWFGIGYVTVSSVTVGEACQLYTAIPTYALIATQPDCADPESTIRTKRSPCRCP